MCYICALKTPMARVKTFFIDDINRPESDDQRREQEQEQEVAKLVKLSCEVCGTEWMGEPPQMCCSGRDCGCMGRPIDPVICSKECGEKLFSGNYEKCDTCGLEIKGESFPVTDENFNKQPGLKQCDRCFGGDSLPF